MICDYSVMIDCQSIDQVFFFLRFMCVFMKKKRVKRELHKNMMRNKLHFLILGLAVYVLVHTELKR